MSECKSHSNVEWIQAPAGSAQKRAGLESALCFGGGQCLVESQHRAEGEIAVDFRALLTRTEQGLRSTY